MARKRFRSWGERERLSSWEGDDLPHAYPFALSRPPVTENCLGDLSLPSQREATAGEERRDNHGTPGTETPNEGRQYPHEVPFESDRFSTKEPGFSRDDGPRCDVQEPSKKSDSADDGPKMSKPDE
jgi:hypothetical protein